jgi:hypothetical protein
MHIFLSEKNGMAITPVFLGESPGAADIGHPALPWLLHVLFPLHDERGEDVMIIGKKGGICMAELSDEKIKVLQKFGFQVNGIIRHKKMGIELDVGELLTSARLVSSREALRDGRAINRTSAERMFQPYEHGYGYGWAVDPIPLDAEAEARFTGMYQMENRKGEIAINREGNKLYITMPKQYGVPYTYDLIPVEQRPEFTRFVARFLHEDITFFHDKTGNVEKLMHTDVYRKPVTAMKLTREAAPSKQG